MFSRGKTKFIRSAIGVGVAVNLLLGFYVPASGAAGDVGLAVSPPTLDLAANPGDTLVNSVRLDNLTDFPITVTVDKRNFVAVGEEGAASLTEENTTFSLSSFIRITPQTVVMAPKSSKVFDFQILVPTNAEPGGHFGSIVFTTKGQQKSGSTVSVSQEISSLLLLRVAGPVNEKASMSSFTAQKKVGDGKTEKQVDSSFFFNQSVIFAPRVKNEGSVHLKPTGSIVIADIFGHKVATLAIDPKNVLPDSIRKLDTEWKPKFMFGKYTASLTLSYGQGNQTLSATTTFFGATKQAAITAAVLLLALIVLFFGRRRFGRALRVLFGRG